MRSVALLDGVPLSMQRRIRWEQNYGVNPVTLNLALTRSRAEELALVPFGPKTLTLREPGKPEVRIKNLFIVDSGPGATPATRTITIADRRWFWGWSFVQAFINIRRFGSISNNFGDRVENFDSVRDVVYKEFSLDSEGDSKGKPWTAVRLLIKVLETVLKQDPSPVSFGFRRRFEFPTFPIEDFILYDNGRDAIRRVLGLLPSVNLTLNKNGFVIIGSEFDRTESEQLKRLPTRHFFSGGLGPRERLNSRPSQVKVAIPREMEIRLDFSEGIVSVSPLRHPELENVVVIPDPELEVKRDDGDLEFLGAGSVLEIQKYLDAINADTRNPKPPNAPKLTLELLRTHALTNFVMIHNLYKQKSVSPNIWNKRIAAITRDWRRLFRIRPFWMDRIAYILNRRVALLDQENALYARGQAFFNYVVRPTQRGISTTNSQREEHGWISDTFKNFKVTNTLAAPVKMRVVDQNIGLIRIIPVPDPYLESSFIIPGLPDTNTLPLTSAVGLNNGAFTFALGWGGLKLRKEFQLSIVLTLGQGGGNFQLDRFHVEHVTLREAAKVLNRENPGQGNGETAVLFVLPSVIKARFAWRDNNEDSIKQTFLSKGDPILPLDLLTTPDHVRNVAVAEAATFYSARFDGVETTAAGIQTDVTPDVVPSGTLRSVVHEMNTDGALTTRVKISQPDPIENIWSLMPDATRKHTLRIVEAP